MFQVLHLHLAGLENGLNLSQYLDLEEQRIFKNLFLQSWSFSISSNLKGHLKK